MNSNLVEEISSKDNSRLKFARACRDGRERNCAFIEGLRLAEEAISARLEIVDYFFTERFAESTRGRVLLDKLQKQSVRGALITNEKTFESIAETKSPQGIVLLAKQPVSGKAVLEKVVAQISNPFLIVLHELNNPQNVGAILRTAEAAGAHAAILTTGSVDVFSPKSLRAAMGSVFRLPLWTNADFAECIEFCKLQTIKTFGTDLKAAKSHFEIDWTVGSALFIGSEAHGLDGQETRLIDQNLKIPMNPLVESLNAAVACGVILYEALRQREKF